MNFNKTLRAKIDKEFPPKVYPCACKFECEHLGGNGGLCDCIYCGTKETGMEPQSASYVGEVPAMEGIF